MGTNTPDIEEILLQMRESFLETAHEKLDRLNELLALFPDAPTDIEYIEEFKREIHSLKGMGGTFQMPVVTKLCHRFECYIEHVATYENHIIDDCHKFLDRISDFIERGETEPDTGYWLNGLPEVATSNVYVAGQSNPLLVIPSSSEHTNTIQNAFQQVGYDLSVVNSMAQAFETAYHAHPEIVIVMQDLSGENGAELLRALGAMKCLSKTKFAMICPNRKEALSENLTAVNLLSEKNLENDVMNFLAIAVTV